LHKGKTSNQTTWILAQKSRNHFLGKPLWLTLEVNKSLEQNEICCMKAKKRVLSFERHSSVQIGDVSQKSKEQNVRLKMIKSRKSLVWVLSLEEQNSELKMKLMTYFALIHQNNIIACSCCINNQFIFNCVSLS
jgi:hypothetical protein